MKCNISARLFTFHRKIPFVQQTIQICPSPFSFKSSPLLFKSIPPPPFSPQPQPHPQPALTLAGSRGSGHYGGFPGATAITPPCHQASIMCTIPSNLQHATATHLEQISYAVTLQFQQRWPSTKLSHGAVLGRNVLLR